MPIAGRARPFQEAGLLVVIAALGVLLALGAEQVTLRDGSQVNNFLRLDNLIPNVATPMAWFAIMALGVTVVIVGGGIDISIGSIFGLAALATAAVLEACKFSEDAPAWQVLPVAIATPLAVGTACGLANGLLVVGLRVHPFIVTLGTLSIYRGLALISVPSKSLPTPDYALPVAFTQHFMAWQINIPRGDGLGTIMLQPVPMFVMLLCGGATWLFLARMVAGREVYAVGGNEEAARFSGISVRRVKLRMYALCGLAAGVAGMVSAGYYGSANTATGEGYELQVIAAAVVGGASLTGGRGTALGAVLGMLVIKLIENGIFILRTIPLGWFTLSLSKEYSKIIIGIAIVLAVAVDRLQERWRR